MHNIQLCSKSQQQIEKQELYRPVVVEMRHLVPVDERNEPFNDRSENFANCQVHHNKIYEGGIVRKTLHVVRLQKARVVDHVVVRRRDGALAHRLRHQVEIEPKR